MRPTPFPTNPSDVAALTVPEFTCELDLLGSATLDAVCRRFLDDTNRSLIWFIRYRALTGWCERTDVVAWLESEPSRAQPACQLAASFALNDDWEFDAERFRSAVDSFTRLRCCARPSHAECWSNGPNRAIRDFLGEPFQHRAPSGRFRVANVLTDRRSHQQSTRAWERGAFNGAGPMFLVEHTRGISRAPPEPNCVSDSLARAAMLRRG